MGLCLQENYAEFHGDGFANKTVTIKPKKDTRTVVDFKEIEVQEVIIEGSNVEIKGDGNVGKVTYVE